MPRLLTLLFVLLLSAPATAQHQHPHSHAADRVVDFPDVAGYLTLSCDFHTHSVFSDGNVWPTIRVDEALRDGLDCLAITEHLEYLPHEDDIPLPDHNRAFTLAQKHAASHDLIVIHGAEVTRAMPPGHANSLFIQDANGLLMADSVAAFQEAARQGGFTFWNHPNWTSQRPDGIATLTDLHRRLIDEGLLHGIEVVNDLTYSDEALQIALDHDLAILGTSDVHGLVDWQYDIAGGGHRPVTLVLADTRTPEGIRAALDARRTIAWYENTLIGRADHVALLLDASIAVDAAYYLGDTSVLRLTLANTSDAAFVLRNTTDYTFHDAADLVTLAPNATTRLDVKTRTRLAEVSLAFEVLNVVTAPNTHPVLTLPVTIR